MALRTAQLSVGCAGPGDDRAAAFAYSGRVVLVVADGAGGTGRGAHAADAVVKLVKERSDAGVLDVLGLLRDCDLNLAREAAGGETTAVVAVVDDKGVAGASVGDSEAWLLEPSRHVDLTQELAINRGNPKSDERDLIVTDEPTA
jgi:serine/threonine protein phosphatase PrpC